MKDKWTFDRIVTFIGLLCTIGFGSWFVTAWDGVVEAAVVRKMNDHTSEVHRVIDAKADTIVSRRLRKHMIKIVKEKTVETAMIAVSESIVGNMDHDEAVTFMNSKMAVLDTLERMLPSIRQTTLWVSEKKQKSEGMIVCGQVYADIVTGIPKFFKDCDGKMRDIYYNFPPGRNLRKKVYYYRDKNDKIIILSYISRVII